MPHRLTLPHPMRPALLLLGLSLAALCHADKVVEIRVTGNAAVTAEAIRKAVEPVLAVGANVDDLPGALAEARRQIMRLGYFESASVTSAKVDGGQSVTIAVTERLRVTKVTFQGNASITADDLSKPLRTRPGRFLVPDLVQRDVQAISALYAERNLVGHVTDVKATPEGEVTFVIAELTVSRVEMAGLRYVTEDDVRPLVTIKAGAPYDETTHAASLKALRDSGWFSEVTEDAPPDPAGGEGRVILRLKVKERPGIFPERTGPPVAKPDPKALRADVGALRLNIQVSADVRMSDVLLDLGEEVDKTLAKLAKAAEGSNARGEAVLQYAQALQALEQREAARVQFTRAEELLRKLTAKEPQNPGPLAGLGRCLHELGRDDEALPALRQAVDLAGDHLEPRLEFVRVGASHILGRLETPTPAGAPAPESLKGAAALRAALELLPTEGSRAAVLGLLKPGGEADPLVALARQVAADLAEARKRAPRDPEVLRVGCEVTFSAVYVCSLVFRSDPAVWTKVHDDVDAFVTDLAEAADKDPAVALRVAMFGGFRAVGALTGRRLTGTSDDDLAAQFSVLTSRLEAVAKKWPRALRVCGNMLGILQFAANQADKARAIFQATLEQNPHSRMNYNGLLGLAANDENWAEMERLVRARMVLSPAAEDYVLLGKIALERDKGDEALADFREAARQFPQDPLGYLAAAGWLVRTGVSDAEATDLLNKGLAMLPASIYGNTVAAVLHVIKGEGPEATASLKTALMADPTDELANLIRDKYFTPAK